MTQTSSQPAAPPRKPVSRLGRWFRSALRWAVAAAVIFAAGIALLWFAQVQPLRAQVDGLRSDLDAAQSEVEALRSLRQENEALQAEATLARSRLLLLRSMVDVTSAQVALAISELNDDAFAAQNDLEVLASDLALLEGSLGET